MSHTKPKVSQHLKGSKIFSNSAWGLVASLLQNIFLSLFFVIIARSYTTTEFAHFLIANTLYQFVAAFAAFGLGQWFMREIVNTQSKKNLIHGFLKMQLYFGIVFFALNIILVFTLYDEYIIRVLSLLFGINIIFDNLIYSIKHVNIAEFEQKKTFTILLIEATAKFGVGCLLFIFPMSIITLSALLIVLRFATLNLFLKIGSPKNIDLNGFWKIDIPYSYIKGIVFKNWPFVIIGSAYIIYWRISIIIISKILTLEDVANYEISFKLFSIAQLVPAIVSTTVFPTLVKLYKENHTLGFKELYKKMYLLYSIFGLLSFTFIYSFGENILPFAFGESYATTAIFTQEMFLTILVYPTVLLQANVLIAMRMEKTDMWFNVLSVILNITLCLIGLIFIKSLSVINYSILISIFIFHVSQDYVLIKEKVTTIPEAINGFAMIVLTCSMYVLISDLINEYILFLSFSLLLLGLCYNKLKTNYKTTYSLR
ncbi:oligosaccharide flippase family protein [Litoribacter alkaliphilus]|uniref:Oligosaccharide flippase family protein n=1 Tax=Litoribacter ruber TaxID=702568 RepID=A0AAP2CGX2_9BACT|nr:oligosaccharide flippase family protein [Litoribacter alkaliphilus]MBS9524518.1 oligosaccharide flippase family protein [Litoribacter alkaliphilus]